MGWRTPIVAVSLSESAMREAYSLQVSPPTSWLFIGLRRRQRSLIHHTVYKRRGSRDRPRLAGEARKRIPRAAILLFGAFSMMTADRDLRRFFDCRIAFVPHLPSQLPSPCCPTVFQGCCCTSSGPCRRIAVSEMAFRVRSRRELRSHMATRRMLDACPCCSPRRALRTDQVLGWATSELSECPKAQGERGSEETWEPGFRKMEALVKIIDAHTQTHPQSRETPIGDWPAIASSRFRPAGPQQAAVARSGRNST